MKNGTRVQIVDTSLKSCGLLGTVVGTKADGQIKIYLDEPVGKGVYLICLKNKASFVPATEQQTSVAEYVRERIEEMQNELQILKNLIL